MAMPDRLSGLAVFAQVVDSGGFSAAARTLGLTPSAVSKQIGLLEDRLGARLLHRTTRRVALTEVGAAFYERARGVLTALDEAERSVTDLNAVPRGTLRLSIPVHFGQFHIAPILPGFMAQYPEVTLDLDMSDRYVDLIGESIDVAVRIGGLQDSSLIVRRLAPNRRIVCASPAYLAAHGTPAAPADLAEHNCLTFHQHGPAVEWRFGEGERRQTVRVSGTLQANNIEALRAAAVAGVGIIRMSAYVLAGELAEGRLVPVLADFEARDAEVYALYPAARHLSPKVRAFVDYLADRIGRPAYWQAMGMG
jgi:DNA-binding transcriptional LysR family regulator